MKYQSELTPSININMPHFISTLFRSVNCDVKLDLNSIHVQLTKEIDKAIMNRPFYWQYNESIGMEGKPASLTFSLNDNSDNGEKLFVGNARFQQLYRFLQNKAKFTKMYEQINTKTNTMLHPWLLINMLITYKGKQTKEKLYSIGLNLINGSVIEQFMNQLKQKDLLPTISNHCYTISPIISLSSGYKRIEQVILEQITTRQHQWALDTYQTLQEELSLIKSLENVKELTHIMEEEKERMMDHLQPKIKMDVLSSGLIYLNAEVKKRAINSH